MDSLSYSKAALRTESKDQLWEQGDQCSAHRTLRLLHAGMGMATETGEFVDVLKRHIFYGKPIGDKEEINLKEEIGDLFWYAAIACDALGISIEDAMIANINKLEARYPEKFDAGQAIERDLEKEFDALVTACADEEAEVDEAESNNTAVLKQNETTLRQWAEKAETETGEGAYCRNRLARAARKVGMHDKDIEAAETWDIVVDHILERSNAMMIPEEATKLQIEDGFTGAIEFADGEKAEIEFRAVPRKRHVDEDLERWEEKRLQAALEARSFFG